MSWTLISLKLPDFTIVAKDGIWRRRSWSMMSREREVLALWRHIRRVSLRVQIGAKAIFTSE